MILTEKLIGKLNEVTVTCSTMDYGSITIDEDLMDAAGFTAGDVVEVNGKTATSRIRTYVLPGPRGTGIIGLRGGASLHFKEGDKVHILKFVYTDTEVYPLIVYTNQANQVIPDAQSIS